MHQMPKLRLACRNIKLRASQKLLIIQCTEKGLVYFIKRATMKIVGTLGQESAPFDSTRRLSVSFIETGDFGDDQIEFKRNASRSWMSNFTGLSLTSLLISETCSSQNCKSALTTIEYLAKNDNHVIGILRNNALAKYAIKDTAFH